MSITSSTGRDPVDTQVNGGVGLEAVKDVVVASLGVEERADAIDADTQLLGSLPELDSMAVLVLEPAWQMIPEERSAHRIASLSIDEESTLQIEKIPHLHGDPFDRILVCQSIVHGLTILTPDPLIGQYPVRVIW
jgi:hypothetical protein